MLGLGARLSAGDVNVLIVNNRGVQNSGGTLTYANALDDAAAALEWLRAPGTRARFRIDPANIVLGGHSFGGSIAILHAARDTSVRHVLSIAGADHGTYARRVREEHGYRDDIRRRLANARAPQGPVRFDPDAVIDDMVANELRYSHPTHATRFPRSLLPRIARTAGRRHPCLAACDNHSRRGSTLIPFSFDGREALNSVFGL